ncbi:uncharacterized protein LOC121864914 [Homarus americanus]|uniref:uncharacterized protein LOC121864914 n=1 Tax=Homarus americanus TaxID=6706 RepID=UPI001C448340|nr:uncharacterized protein LOC121864914 [Homarus americanus]
MCVTAGREGLRLIKSFSGNRVMWQMTEYMNGWHTVAIISDHQPIVRSASGGQCMQSTDIQIYSALFISEAKKRNMVKFTYQVMLVVTVVLHIVVLAIASSYPSRNSVMVRSDDDLLDKPEWLQNIPEESKVAKYRKRRFVAFPTGSVLGVDVTLQIPVVGVSDTDKLALASQHKFNLPNNSANYGRELGGGLTNRMGFYHGAEQFLDSLGYDGHSCILRTICEVAEMPFQQGLLGEVVNLLLLVVSGSYSEVENSVDEYTTAQYYGQHHGSCFAIYPKCPISFTNLLTRLVPVQ